MQLERVREETEQNRRREEAAKAVMAAARNAQRNGEVLSAEEIQAIEASILYPEAEEEEEEEAAVPEPPKAAAKVPPEFKFRILVCEFQTGRECSS